MSDPLLVLLLTIGLSLLIGFSGWSLFRNRSSTRYPVRAAGLICLLIGLYVTGISELLLVAVRGLIGWFGAQRWDTHMWIGIGACVLGALAYLIGGRIGVPPRAEEAKPKRIRPRPAGDRQAIPAPAPQQPAAGEEPTLIIPAGTQVSTPDDQVSAILRKHGLE